MTVIAVSPLLATFHQLSERHAVCEHGELVESEHGLSTIDERAVANVEVARRAVGDAPVSDIRSDSGPVLHGHRHCSVGTLAKSSVAVLPCTAFITELSEVDAGEPHPSDFTCVRTILLSAPKTSPPRVAS